ncbi:MAG: FAD-dependent oxidoreductase [Rhodobacteraceae bacterium]|nr:FAD-dependent oxidoreductase [Paracoccaceae bacterium]
MAKFADQIRQLFPPDDDKIVNLVVLELQNCFPAMPFRPLFGMVARWPEAVHQCPGGMLAAGHKMRLAGSLRQVEGLFLVGNHMRLPVTAGAMQSCVGAVDDCHFALAWTLPQ